MNTYFAPAERVPQELLEATLEEVLEDPLVHVVLTAIDGFVVILNPQRQVLAANEKVLCTLGIDPDECLGRRPGEILCCVNATKGPGGCGTARECSQCGAVLAILGSMAENRPVEAECLLTRRVGHSLEAAEFRVRSTPLKIGEHRLLAFVLQDISAAKRREILEKTFLHDLVNSLGGLHGLIELWEEDDVEDFRAFHGDVSRVLKEVLDEIETHRLVHSAERGELTVEERDVAPSHVIEKVASIFKRHGVATGKHLRTSISAEERPVHTDPALLTRILVNMTKNAFEATPTGGTVTVGFEWRDDRPRFSTHNPGQIPEAVALQIFKRSYSTKGATGRGLGAYSMKLLGEDCLHAEVGFTTDEREGTQFYILLP